MQKWKQLSIGKRSGICVLRQEGSDARKKVGIIPFQVNEKPELVLTEEDLVYPKV